jgi:hypothetical protein
MLLADVLPGPEIVLPALVLSPALAAAGVFTARGLRRRGWGRVAATAVGLAVFVALEMAACVAGAEWDASSRRDREDARIRAQLEADRAPGQVP